MLGIEDKWVALACLLCIALPLSLLAVVVSSFAKVGRSAPGHLFLVQQEEQRNENLNSSFINKTLKTT